VTEPYEIRSNYDAYVAKRQRHVKGHVIRNDVITLFITLINFIFSVNTMKSIV